MPLEHSLLSLVVSIDLLDRRADETRLRVRTREDLRFVAVTPANEKDPPLSQRIFLCSPDGI